MYSLIPLPLLLCAIAFLADLLPLSSHCLGFPYAPTCNTAFSDCCVLLFSLFLFPPFSLFVFSDVHSRTHHSPELRSCFRPPSLSSLSSPTARVFVCKTLRRRRVQSSPSHAQLRKTGKARVNGHLYPCLFFSRRSIRPHPSPCFPACQLVSHLSFTPIGLRSLTEKGASSVYLTPPLSCDAPRVSVNPLPPALQRNRDA